MSSVHEIGSREAFDALLAESHERPVAILKHSRACGLSTSVRREFETTLADLGGTGYLVVVQSARDVSNYIETMTGVRHESPQVLILAAGRVSFHASHSRVTAAALRRAYTEAQPLLTN